MVEKTTVMNALGKTSILGSDIELDISLLLKLFPEEDREEEVKQVRVYCLILAVFPCIVFHIILFLVYLC